MIARETQAIDFGRSPGGGKRVRTADPLLAKQVLFQLSYTPGDLEYPSFTGGPR